MRMRWVSGGLEWNVKNDFQNSDNKNLFCIKLFVCSIFQTCARSNVTTHFQTWTSCNWIGNEENASLVMHFAIFPFRCIFCYCWASCWFIVFFFHTFPFLLLLRANCSHSISQFVFHFLFKIRWAAFFLLTLCACISVEKWKKNATRMNSITFWCALKEKHQSSVFKKWMHRYGGNKTRILWAALCAKMGIVLSKQ